VLVDRPTGTGPLPFDGTNDTTIETHSLSADGRFVVFTSGSDALLAGDEDSATNVYRLDLSTGTLVQVDTTAAGGQPAPQSTSGDATISADGRYVAFISSNSGLIPDAPISGVYVKDLRTGALTLASRATGPDGAPSVQVFRPVISGDGRHVAFFAGGPLHADNADGVQGKVDAYVRALDAGTTHMVSVTSAGAEGGGVSSFADPDIDFAGDAVAFVTSASLDPADTVADEDAYVRTGIGGVEHTVFVSSGTGSSGQASQIALSGDGSRVAWNNGFADIYMSVLSGATAGAPVWMNVMRPGGRSDSASTPVFEPVANAATTPARLTFLGSALDPADTNNVPDLYAAEVAHPGDPQFVHLETSGTANAAVEAGAAAANGSVVVFESASPSLTAADGVRRQIYLQTPNGAIVLSQPTGAARASESGRAFIDARHAVSDDGRMVVFDASAPVFGSPVSKTSQHDFAAEVLVRDVVANRTILASAAPDGSPADGSAGRPSIDAAGDRVAFTSSASNLVPGVTGTHAYVRDLATGTTTLVDRTTGGAPLTQGVSDVRLSADGRHVAYVSGSPDAPAAPANDQNAHVYVVDLGTGATVLADRASGAAGAVADASSFRVDINGDGSRVAFVSAADNLGAGATGGKRQVYVRDLTAQTTTWASAPEDGNPQHASADSPSLDRAGDVVAFQQTEPGFGHGMTGSSQIFVRDLTTGTTELASQDTAGAALGTDASDPSLSADGSELALTAGTSTPSGAGTFEVYIRDRATATTTLASVARDGVTPATLGAVGGSLSGPGDCVAFLSSSTDLVTPSYGPDFEHVYLHALTPRCPAIAAGDSGGPPPPHDTTPPRILHARLTAKHFAPGARGIAFVFTLSENAATTITLVRTVAGPGHGRPAGTIRAAHTHAGANRVSFPIRVEGRKLPPGRYRAQLVARDPSGNRSRAVSIRFTIVLR
jgi:Tol biopolymer transport system component